MYVIVVTTLSFISISMIFDIELLLQHVNEKHLSTNNEILRYDVRILLQKLCRDDCFNKFDRDFFISLSYVNKSMIVKIVSLHIDDVQRVTNVHRIQHLTELTSN